MAICEKCGSENVTFRRESVGSVSNSDYSRTASSKHSSGSRVNQTVREFRTIGFCKDCGYTWTVSEEESTAVTGNSGKACNKIVSLVLCILFGYLGAHRFYEGNIKMGVLFLCTVGLFGIGWIVDIVRIARKPSTYYV